MKESLGIETLIERQRELAAPHADALRDLLPAAVRSHEALVSEMVSARQKRVSAFEALPAPSLDDGENDAPRREAEERLRARVLKEAEVPPPEVGTGSKVAQAWALQPVRDLTVEWIVILTPDTALDVIGAPYVQEWTFTAGNVHPSKQSVFANRAAGTFGFSHQAEGQQSYCGAGLFVPFTPRVAPGFAQVRPYAPFAYRWANLSFRSRERNAGGFGVRVFSWDAGGGDQVMEQDYRYFAWDDSIGAYHFATSNSPSWITGGPEPGWDYDHAFLYGKEAPYFRTRPNRHYWAAVWCLGECISAGERPGLSISRMEARLPWVVVGYQ